MLHNTSQVILLALKHCAPTCAKNSSACVASECAITCVKNSTACVVNARSHALRMTLHV